MVRSIGWIACSSPAQAAAGIPVYGWYLHCRWLTRGCPLDSGNPLGWPLTSGPKAWSAEQGWALATVKPLTRPLHRLLEPAFLLLHFRFYWQITLLCPQITSNLLVLYNRTNKWNSPWKMLKTLDSVTYRQSHDFFLCCPPFVVHWNSLLLWFTTFCFLLDLQIYFPFWSIKLFEDRQSIVAFFPASLNQIQCLSCASLLSVYVE